MLSDIRLEDIEASPYNSRLRYSTSDIERMAKSIARNGQLSTIRVRPNPLKLGSFQLVFGHRRVLAARKLGWKTIKAEVIEAGDQQMAIQSLVENFERSDTSDYEKALCFDRLNKEFEMTYEEIGELVGSQNST